MSFTWNGQPVSDIIPVRATVEIDNYLLTSGTAMNATLIEEKVKMQLSQLMVGELHKFMSIKKHEDYATLRKIYEGTVYMAVPRAPLNNPTTLPGFVSTSPLNGTSLTTANIVNTSNSSVREYDKLRVCEYTKNGKVTRVELQRYEDGFWEKIPRVQIEE